MINYLRIILISIVFIQLSTAYSQQLKNSTETDSLIGTNEPNAPGIMFSLGAGSSVYETSFILSPDISWDLTENASVSTGTDIYFARKNSDTKVSINLISYYKFKPTGKTIFQIGFGGAYFNKSILPLFSARVDYRVLGNSYLGAGIKSMIAFGGDKFPFPALLLNYSVRF
jgi:hypothetical protein